MLRRKLSRLSRDKRLNYIWHGQGLCGSVGSKTRGLRFESSHWQIIVKPTVECQLYLKDKNKQILTQLKNVICHTAILPNALAQIGLHI